MKAFRLEGSSMKPLFKEGDIVLVEDKGRRLPVAGCRPNVSATLYPLPAALSAGDCAVYRFEGRTLLHRVIRTEEKGVWFSDDSGRLAPHFVPWKDIEGKVLSDHPLKSGRAGLVYSKLRRLLGTAPCFSFLVPGLRRDNR